ncbi:Serine/threonine protein kinase [Phytophthora megakarya]|uniref:Serine/threonine protein kinase n=1 Tax=Phytophthora megakarya TaxID=4795 RepID=A0A225V2R4_9STRA|nr:Serine/threonine protein kinase [Phytophthora megakarya]
MKAVFLKDVDIERYIVEHGMDVNATDFYRNTTLMWAARIGNNDIVRYLATEGAPLNVVNADGATAVMLAAERGHTETVKLLVEYGADVNFTTDGKDTALMKAKRNNHADVVHFLVVDACTKVTGNFGDIVLMAAGNGCIDIIQYIVENGLVDVNVTDKNRETALMKAAGNNHIDIVRYLIEHEAEVNAVNDWGCTALMLAARWEQLELVRCIAEHPRADVNIHDFYGGTALMKAALNGHSKVVRYLAGERGADANAADISGDTALMLAAERGHTEVVQYLADDYGANVNTKNNDGITALMWAAERGYLGIVQCLAKHCGDVMNTMDDEGHTALMKAVTSEQVDVVQYLIYQGNVDVNAINDWGETAYRLAYIRGYQDIRQILTPFLSSSPAPFTYDGGKKKKRISSQQIPGLVPPSEVALIALCQEGHIGGEYRAKWLDADVVVKLYIPDTSYSSFEEESRLWQKLRHPNVMKIYGACYAGPHLQFFVCEHTNNGSLLEYLKRLAKIGGNDVERVEYLSSVTLKFMHEAVLGLEYLHERGIVHGDLRCNNILIGGDGLAKLSNFSLCSSMDKSNQFSTKIVESIRWQSPEVMKGEQPSFASDVYSLGMCILEAMTILYEESSEWVMKFKTNWDPKAYLEQCTPPGVLWQMCCWKTSDRPSLSSVVYELEQLSLRQNVDLHERDSDNSISIDEYKQGKLVEVWLGLQRAMVNCKSEQHRWIFNELTKVHNILKSSAHPTLFANFYALLTDFYQIIKMSPEQARIVRLSSTRATTTSFYALRWRIESLLKILKGSTHNTNEIQERWSDQIMFFVSGMSDTYLLLKELKSVEERSAFLNLLETEIGNAHLKYTPDQLEVMKTTYETIASTIDANDRSFIIPEWFIPWYELIIDTYNKLGEGGFGSVYQAKWLDSDVVVKQIFVIGDDKHFPDNSFYSSLSASLNPLSAPLDETKRGEALAMFRREVDIWFALNHPHVIRLFGACHIGRPFFVCEYATNGTMITTCTLAGLSTEI